MFARPPRSPPFPYTTLFRSRLTGLAHRLHDLIALRHFHARVVLPLPDQQRLGDLVRLVERRALLEERLVLLQIADALGEQGRSEEHTSELQSQDHLVCRLLL